MKKILFFILSGLATNAFANTALHQSEANNSTGGMIWDHYDNTPRCKEYVSHSKDGSKTYCLVDHGKYPKS